MMWFYKPKLAYHSVKANSEFSFSEKRGVIQVRVMRPTIKDANFHFSYAHSAIFSLPLQKKFKEVHFISPKKPKIWRLSNRSRDFNLGEVLIEIGHQTKWSL